MSGARLRRQSGAPREISDSLIPAGCVVTAAQSFVVEHGCDREPEGNARGRVGGSIGDVWVIDDCRTEGVERVGSSATVRTAMNF